MKKMRKVLSFILTLVMVLTMAAPSFAQEVSVSTGSATITIENAAKGETYKIYKLFDATVTGTAKGSIAYTGDIPESLAAYFEKDTAGNIHAKDAAWVDPKAEDKVMSDGLKTALKEWTDNTVCTKDAVSDGSELEFTGVKYGYYVVTTTQGNQAVTVVSTNPSAIIVDKNSTTIGENDLTKTVDDNDVSIGDTVTYTVKFKTVNYDGAGEDAEKVESYTITDSLPDFLKNVSVTSIVVDNDGDVKTTTNDQTSLTVQQFQNKQITIPWVDNSKNFLYKNGAYVIITYTAVVTDKAVIAGEGNTNEVTLTWNGNSLTADETISTYAIAIKKVDQGGNNLKGAQFSVAGINVNKISDGNYIVTAKGDNITSGAMTCDDNGELVIKGVESGEYSITEEVAPNGYNKLTESQTIEVATTDGTTTSAFTYLDANGDISKEQTDTTVTVEYKNNDLAASSIVIVNKTGAMLPSTGGIGTTVFYAIGIVLMAGAVFFVVRRKRA